MLKVDEKYYRILGWSIVCVFVLSYMLQAGGLGYTVWTISRTLLNLLTVIAVILLINTNNG